MPVHSDAERRNRAIHRRRRVLLNNDGSDVTFPRGGTPEGLLSQRTTPYVGTHVDTILYCTHHSFTQCTHQTSVGEMLKPNPRWAEDHVGQLIRQGRDCLRIVTDYCHDHDMEAFCSMRMNDVHDGALPEHRSKFKNDRPDLLLGHYGDQAEQKIGQPRWWSGINYEHAEVRDIALRLVEEVFHNYDVDGVELDYFRHPVYFQPNRQGLPAEPRHVEMMTDFMRRVHAAAVTRSRGRLRPLLVAVRVPDTIETCLYMGFDIETWVKEHLIDLLIPSGYYRLGSWDQMIELGHAHDVPVYPCVSATRLRASVAKHLDREHLFWRAEALNIWDGGADGVYTFNYFDFRGTEGRGTFLELGDPDLLRQLPRIHAPSPGTIDKWLGEKVRLRYGHLPLAVARGEPQPGHLHIFERISDNCGLTLRLRLSEFLGSQSVKVTLNDAPVNGLQHSPISGTRVSHVDVQEMPGCWVEAAVEAPVLRVGKNRVVLAPPGRADGDDPILQDLHIEVKPRSA